MSCRINVILDLDNTIINALSDSDRNKLNSEFSNQFDHASFRPYFKIYARPHLQEFLDYLFAHFNVAVITAAEKEYALSIVDQFILRKDKPERKLEFVFYRYQVDLSRELYGGMKDLRIVWDMFRMNGFQKYNTIIIDDLDLVYNSNPYNTLRIPGFFVVDEDNGKINYESINDTALLDMMKTLEFIRLNYGPQLCEGLNKAILEYSSVSNKLITSNK